ncbi:MAG: Hint domain-containing protein, partial [Tateyamaria sp.]
LDSDNDGISDIQEGGLDISAFDTDGNGTIDASEIVDTNNDGLDDRVDELDGTLDGQVAAPRDTDGDGVADYLDLDSDNDGVSDLQESGISPLLNGNGDGQIGILGGGVADLNQNGIADVVETATGVPVPQDSDNDGIADYIDLDSDDDGISDYIESQSTADFVAYDGTDTDGDGVIDLVDTTTGHGGTFNPTLADTDGDGDADLLDTDTDNDGFNDSSESGLAETGTSTNGIDDGSNVTFADQDGQTGNTQAGVDGLEDGLENGTDADTSDVDFRSIDDADGDGIADNIDLDDDNDGILDVAEGAQEGNGSGFYQVLSGQLLDYDFVTNEYIEVGDPAGFGYNALAIDPGTDDGAVDDVIYAVATGNGTDADGGAVARGDIITIDPETGDVFGGPSIVLTDGAGSTFSDVNTIAAAFHDDALVIRGPGNALYEVDPLTGAGTEIAGSSGFTPVDFAIIDGVAYGGSNGDLFSFDFNAASPDVEVQALGGPSVPGGGNGAVFSAEGDRLFFSNADSNLYEVTDYDTSSPQIEFFASLPAPTNDGASNGTLTVPTPGDTDGDGILDSEDLDSDNDGISDIEESGVDVSLYDTDGNGTIDADEIVDTNNDGLDDRIDELDGTLDGEVNAARDTDGDGIADYLDLDSDNDGISDLRESGIDPALDADNDGTIDINADGSAGGEAADLNRDGIADVVQQDAGGATIPLTVADTDNDGLADYIDLDSDDDGISDFIESRPTDDFVPYDNTDSDGDGIIDLVDNDPAPNFAFGGDFNPALPDTDGNGTADVLDLDSDGDGILDENESGLTGTGTSTNGIDDGSNVTFADQDGQVGNTETGVDGLEDYTDNTSDNDATDVDFRSVQDSDNDGIGDHEDLDDDNDGILDADEIGDTDGDGIDDRLDLDSDNDGISDLEESGIDLDVFDTDRDGQIDGTDFTDTNNDGLDDGADALDGTSLDGGTDAPRDTDGDGVADQVDLDSDNDGISDLRESGTDPALDANNDGTLDLTPGTGEATDINSDGIADAVQQDAGGNPAPFSDARDSDNDGIADHIDIDADNDGITDFIEAQSTADYQGTDGDVRDNDADGDGVLNIFETGDVDDGLFGGAFEAPEDTDGTGDADYLDLDSDDDGSLDEDESGFDNSGPDNNGDGLSDTAPGSFTDPSGGVDDLLTDLESGTDVDTTETDFRSVPCFVRGTLIATKKGQISIEDLAVGDEVFTVDAGYQPILWIGSRGLSAADLVMHPKLHPVRIKAGALAPNCPEKDLYVSPQHRILIRSKIAQRMFGENEILVPAIKLTGLDGIEVVEAWHGVEYFHILFEHHQIVVSNGARTESLFTGTEAMKSLSQEAKAEIETLFPEIMQPGFEPVSARAIPTKGRQIRNMVERICKNERLPVETDAV